MTNTRKPLALLDIDGVLNLYAYVGRRRNWVSEDPEPDGSFPIRGQEFTVLSGRFEVFQLFWRSDLPNIISDLRQRFDLVWATSWNHHANDYWLDKTGLTEPLPVIHLDFDLFDGPYHLCWKTAQVNKWLLEHHGNDVTGVWFDDEVSRKDRPHLPAGMLPIRTLDHLGLTPELLEQAGRHADTVRA